MILATKELVINFITTKSDFTYKLLQLFPTLIAVVTVYLARKQWQKDGYLKRKIELELAIMQFLIIIEPFVYNLISKMNNDNIYSLEQLLEMQIKLYNLTEKLRTNKRALFKKLQEYKMFKNNCLVDNLMTNYDTIISFGDYGMNIQLDENTFAHGCFDSVNDEKISEYSDIIRKFNKNFFELKRSIEKKFKKL